MLVDSERVREAGDSGPFHENLNEEVQVELRDNGLDHLPNRGERQRDDAEQTVCGRQQPNG